MSDSLNEVHEIFCNSSKVLHSKKMWCEKIRDRPINTGYWPEILMYIEPFWNVSSFRSPLWSYQNCQQVKLCEHQTTGPAPVLWVGSDARHPELLIQFDHFGSYARGRRGGGGPGKTALFFSESSIAWIYFYLISSFTPPTANFSPFLKFHSSHGEEDVCSSFSVCEVLVFTGWAQARINCFQGLLKDFARTD